MRNLSLLATLLACTVVSAAHAEAPQRTDRDVARDIARRGAEYFDEGDWERAREHFHRAYELVHAPTLVLMEARCLTKLGRLAEAMDAYSKAATQDDEGNEIFRRATSDARRELVALSPRVPSIRVVISTAVQPRPIVRVDGAIVEDTPSTVNPGTHVLAISRTGAPESWQSVTLAEGEQRTIAIDAPRMQVTTGAETSRPLAPVMWTAFAVGGAGLVTGIVSGAIALDRKDNLDQACPGGACPPDREGDLHDYRRWRTVSTIGYVVGAVGLAGGAVLFATSSSAKTASTAVKAVASPGGSGLLVEGRF